MDQQRLLLASLLDPSMGLRTNSLVPLQQLSRPSMIGSGLGGLLGATRTRTTSTSSTSSAATATGLLEQKLMLDLLKAESAIEEYQNSVAEELALRASLARTKREYLRATASVLAPSTRTKQQPLTAKDLLLVSASSSRKPSLFAESCVIPVKDTSSSSSTTTIAVPKQQPIPAGSLPELSSLCSSMLRADASSVVLVKKKEIKKQEQKSLSPAKLMDLQRPPSSSSGSLPVAKRRRTKRWDVSISFPSKLFDMLQEAESEGHDDIISFLPDGKSFMIHEPDKLAQTVLPKYFRTSRLSSLQKQLSLYGFKRMRSGPDVGAIHHEYFRRDNKKLVAKITRKRQLVPVGEVPK